MNENILAHLRRIEIFAGLSDKELMQIAAICRVERTVVDQVIFKEGADGDDLFVILTGSVRVALNTRAADGTIAPNTINKLYTGQSFGEMALIGGTPRSATISSVDNCSLLVLNAGAFTALCETEPHIGFLVMRNLASDLAYKLRSSNLLLRGIIRWQHDELSHG